jgi:hypothetical protein
LASFRKVTVGSERKFGLTVGGILVVLAVWPLLRHHETLRIWLLIPGLILVLAGLLAPNLLAPLNKAWFQLGLALARVTNPIFMGAMFYGAVVPLGWFLRRNGHDLLRLKRNPKVTSYWIERSPQARTSLDKQF